MCLAKLSLQPYLELKSKRSFSQIFSITNGGKIRCILNFYQMSRRGKKSIYNFNFVDLSGFTKLKVSELLLTLVSELIFYLNNHLLI